MEWKVDTNELLALLGRTIYRPENVLVELAANSYDADATKVNITSSGESNMIQIIDDGCGMDLADLDELITIAKSKKRKMLEDGETTPVFNRRLLGCFGIGIISFLSLGNRIRIFTCKEGNDPIFVAIQKDVDAQGKTVNVEISAPDENERFRMHLIDGEASQHGTTIEIENSVLDFSENYQILRHKLSNLPLGDSFQVFLNESEIRSDDFPSNRWILKPVEFVLDEIDPNYKSSGQINVYYDMDAPNETLERFKRGIFLKVHGRVIEEDLYNRIRGGLTSPAAIDARIRGLIEADYLNKKIQANREDFFDNEIVQKIGDKILPLVQQQINDYLQLKEYVSEETYMQQYFERRNQAIERTKSPHLYLSKLNLGFPFEPESEQEFIVLIAQLCQMGHLPFTIISSSSGAHIDCIVQWPIEQKKRMPDFVGHLEIETSLDKFFTHQHDYRTKPEICCWSISERDFERRIQSYKAGRPQSIVEIKLVTPSAEESSHYGHQREVYVTTQNLHNEQRTSILRVYVVSEIIEGIVETTNGS
jgi:hypothetical protein